MVVGATEFGRLLRIKQILWTHVVCLFEIVQELNVESRLQTVSLDGREDHVNSPKASYGIEIRESTDTSNIYPYFLQNPHS